MMLVLSVLLVGGIAALGLFPGLMPRPPAAPVPCCSPAGGFQTTFALSSSDIAMVDDGAPFADKERIARLEMELEDLRQKLQIPGFSAAVTKNGQVLWARGFGCADIATGTPATPHTPYHLASLTKPIAATILFQLVEEGLVYLDDPLSFYDIWIDTAGTPRVEHLLSHTSQGIPGTRYHYSGDRFGLIDRVLYAVTAKSVRRLFAERVLAPLGMDDAMPAPVGQEVAAYRAGDGDPRYQNVWDRLATPYWYAKGYGNVVGLYAEYFGSAAGLIASVLDYAKFDAAIDGHALISEETQELAWTPYRSRWGRDLPYGYGWFIDERGGRRYIWHYGYWSCTSTLVVKVPDHGLTFLLFANSDRLSSPFRLGADCNVRRSPAARAFLDTFVE